MSLKQIFDHDTGKVLMAATLGIGDAFTALDMIFKIVISILTIWYLWRKIHPSKHKTNEREKYENPLE